jgi:mRNA interferase RelE/StbE
MRYSVQIEKSSLKALKKLPKGIVGILSGHINSLQNNPRPSGCKKLKGVDLYRIRAGNYRVVYQIHDKILVVLIVAIGNRKEIYRNL